MERAGCIDRGTIRSLRFVCTNVRSSECRVSNTTRTKHITKLSAAYVTEQMSLAICRDDRKALDIRGLKPTLWYMDELKAGALGNIILTNVPDSHTRRF